MTDGKDVGVSFVDLFLLFTYGKDAPVICGLLTCSCCLQVGLMLVCGVWVLC